MVPALGFGYPRAVLAESALPVSFTRQRSWGLPFAGLIPTERRTALSRRPGPPAVFSHPASDPKAGRPDASASGLSPQSHRSAPEAGRLAWQTRCAPALGLTASGVCMFRQRDLLEGRYRFPACRPRHRGRAPPLLTVLIVETLTGLSRARYPSCGSRAATDRILMPSEIWAYVFARPLQSVTRLLIRPQRSSEATRSCPVQR